MRATVMGILLAGAVSTAAAGDYTYMGTRYAGNDYSAKLYYTLDFGGTQRHSQSVGLRLNNEGMALRGAPALFQVEYTGTGQPTVALQGLQLTRSASSNLIDVGATASWSAGEWFAVGLATVTIGGLGAAAVSDSNKDTPAVAGTGGTGSGP